MKSSTIYRIRETVKTLSTDADQTQKAVNEIETAIRKDSEYIGWSNFETWLMSLNLDNEQALTQELMRIANQTVETYDKAQELKSWVESEFYIEESGVYKICDTWTERDFQEINWYEIIEAHLDELYEIEEDETNESTDS